MPAAWKLSVFENEQLVFSDTCSMPLELGRQSEGESTPYVGRAEAGGWRVVLARLDEEAVSRKHVRVDVLPDGRVRVTNLSRKLSIRFPDATELGPAGRRDVGLPVALLLGARLIRIEATESVEQLHSLPGAPPLPGSGAADDSLLRTTASGPPGEALVRWLQTAMDVLQSATGSNDFFNRAARALVDMVGLDAGRVLLLGDGEWRVQTLHLRPQLAPPDWQPSRQILERLVAEKRTFWQVPAAASESLQRVRALVAAPILNRYGAVIGALYGDRGEAGAPVSRLQAVLVELLASGVAAGLARLEQEQVALEGHKKLLRIESELEIGRQIQASFLPESVPQPAGWEVVAYFQPAREVSGDFYDAFPLPGGYLALVIADVCDKGVGSALYMTLVRTLLRAFARQGAARGLFESRGPGAAPAAETARRRSALLADLTALSAIELTNNYVAEEHGRTAMFATVFFAVLDPATASLTYVNAGHDAPIVIRAAGLKDRLGPTGPAVGIMPHAVYDFGCVQLEPGDTLLAYTDGVTEAKNVANQLFTDKRLLEVVPGPNRSATDLLSAVRVALREHTANAEPSDDVTMLAVRRRP